MSLVRCPECNAKISDTARACPRCGFAAENHLLPISQQICAEAVPSIACEIEQGSLFESVLLNAVTIENHSELSNSIGNMAWLGLHLPGLAEAISNLAQNEGKLVADLNPYLRKMIANGTFTLNVDSANQILPTIRDASGKIVQQVRLKPEMLSGTGALSGLCSSVATHMAMAQLMEEMKDLQIAVQGIHAEIQQDRLSKYEAAREMFLQAQKMVDPDMREKVLLIAVQTASEARHALMRNLSLNLRQVRDASQKSASQMMFDSRRQRDIPTKAADAFNDLTYATAACQVESFAYISLGEKQAAADCLEGFLDYLINNRLDENDTLIMLHENLGRTQKNAELLEQWIDVTDHMLTFKSETLLANTDEIKNIEEEH